MNRRTILIVALLIFSLSLLLFLVSWLVQPLLPETWNRALFLLGVVVAGVVAFLASLNDIQELVAKWQGKSETETTTPLPPAEPPIEQKIEQKIEGSLNSGHQEIHGDFAGRDLTKTTHVYPNYNPQQEQEKEIKKATGRYLRELYTWCNDLPLALLGGEAGELHLAQVYIELDTTTVLEEEKEARSRSLFNEDDKRQRLSALQAATIHPRLVLLGHPGSGKSSFAQRLSGWLARAALQEGEPPADWPVLIPLFVRLRDMAPALKALDLPNELSTEEKRRRLAQTVLAQWQNDLAERWKAPELQEEIKEWLSKGEAFLVFDGLDEVPEDVRIRAVEAVEAVKLTYRACTRLLVTCRINSYVGQSRLAGFHDEMLASFSKKKIHQFVEGWYREQKGLLADEVTEKIKDLQRAAVSDDLITMAENPMLLTVMAIIHQKNTRLPNQRVAVYDEAVKILLERWQKDKGFIASPALLQVLRNPGQLRRLVQRIAYAAHERQQMSGQREQAADLPRGYLLTLLEKPLYLKSSGLADEFLDYIDKRSGLFAGYGGGIVEEGQEPEKPAYYAFPHRTFQEYLAGCHLLAMPDPGLENGYDDRETAYLAKMAAGDYWYLAAQLGVEQLYYQREEENGALRLAYALCPVAEPDSEARWRGVVLSGHIALLFEEARIEADKLYADGGKNYLQRLRERLTVAMGKEALPVNLRLEAGQQMGQLGDGLRPGVLGVGEMGVCFVPAGKFWMGAGDAGHENGVAYPYWLGQYPVTQAQYGLFVAEGGYEDGAFWQEAREAGFWRDGKFKAWQDSEWREKPHDFGFPFGLPNHPVVGVTWYEAVAFCRWVTARWGVKEKGWEVVLPSEAEWEKGARGGEMVVGERLIRPLAGLPRQPEVALVKNEGGQRRFPWGDEGEALENRANYGQKVVKSTSAVGCFPHSCSPYGCEEMAGNVWEWTRSLDGKYPYVGTDGRENPAKVKPNSLIILRGGSWVSDADALVCARRNWFNPNDRFDPLGFRVCVRPLFP